MDDHSNKNVEMMKKMGDLAKDYSKWIEDEMSKSKEEFAISKVGKIDPKRHLTSVLLIFFINYF